MKKLFHTKRGIEPKRSITFDKTQFDPVLRTLNLLYKAHDGGFATYETVKDNLLNSVGKLLYLPYAKSLRSQTGTSFIALLGTILIKKLLKVTGISILALIIVIIVAFNTIKNPHLFFNISNILISGNNLSLAELFTKKGIEINTIENLRKVHGNKSQKRLKHQMKLEYGNLYSQAAWINYKKQELNDAENFIQKAIEYKDSSIQPDPLDWIRFGIINYAIGNKDIGWKKILDALIENTDIENTDPSLKLAINNIFKERSNLYLSLEKYLEKVRYENAEVIPNLSITVSDTLNKSLHDLIAEVFVVTFFSPTCGSCRQELTNINKVFKNRSTRLIFILNQPQRIEQAYELLKDLNYKNKTLAALNHINTYDIITAEPTTWIISRQGKVIYKHVAYQQGYARILCKLCDFNFVNYLPLRTFLSAR